MIENKFNGKGREYKLFFFCLGFLSRTFTAHRTAREREVVSLIPLYYVFPLNRYLITSGVIIAGSSPMPIASSRT